MCFSTCRGITPGSQSFSDPGEEKNPFWGSPFLVGWLPPPNKDRTHPTIDRKATICNVRVQPKVLAVGEVSDHTPARLWENGRPFLLSEPRLEDCSWRKYLGAPNSRDCVFSFCFMVGLHGHGQNPIPPVMIPIPTKI